MLVGCLVFESCGVGKVVLTIFAFERSFAILRILLGRGGMVWSERFVKLEVCRWST